jgi:hypothetical protein
MNDLGLTHRAAEEEDPAGLGALSLPGGTSREALEDFSKRAAEAMVGVREQLARGQSRMRKDPVLIEHEAQGDAREILGGQRARKQRARRARDHALRAAGSGTGLRPHALWHKHVHNVELDPLQSLKMVEMDENPNTWTSAAGERARRP